MYLPKEFIATFNSWGMKMVVLVVCLLISYYFFNYNRFGKNMKAIGGNATVAELNGIPVTKYIVLAHMAAGLCVAIASIFSLARAGSCNATAGAGVQMDVMIGLVLGGVPMTGGVKSKSSAIIIGGLITAILSNGLLICGVSPYAVEGLTGAVFIIVVAMKTKRTAASILS
jgi:ribose transport system permease protein